MSWESRENYSDFSCFMNAKSVSVDGGAAEASMTTFHDSVFHTIPDSEGPGLGMWSLVEMME